MYFYQEICHKNLLYNIEKNTNLPIELYKSLLKLLQNEFNKFKKDN